MSRTDQLLQLRPNIPSIEDNAVNDAEVFQNNTLRPILKFQNELLLIIFKAHLVKRKISFTTSSSDQQSALIENILKTDLKFRNLMLGTIIGHFTSEEWAEYLLLERELNKRIISMLIQRIKSQIKQ